MAYANKLRNKTYTEGELTALYNDKDTDINARNELIIYHTRLAIGLAHNSDQAKNGDLESIEELTSIAIEALIKAVNGYDVVLGNKFSTYASPIIERAIKKEGKYISNTIHVPSKSQNKSNIAVAIENKLKIKLKRSPTYAEIAAERLDVFTAEKDVKIALEIGRYNYMFSPKTDDDDESTIESFADSSSLEDIFINVRYTEQMISRIKKFNKQKTSAENMMIFNSYFELDGQEKKTFSEIADLLNIKGITSLSAEGVRQRLAKLLKSLNFELTLFAGGAEEKLHQPSKAKSKITDVIDFSEFDTEVSIDLPDVAVQWVTAISVVDEQLSTSKTTQLSNDILSDDFVNAMYIADSVAHQVDFGQFDKRMAIESFYSAQDLISDNIISADLLQMTTCIDLEQVIDNVVIHDMSHSLYNSISDNLINISRQNMNFRASSQASCSLNSIDLMPLSYLDSAYRQYYSSA